MGSAFVVPQESGTSGSVSESDTDSDNDADSGDEGASSEAREAERLRVLEAAGLLIKTPSAEATPKRRPRRPPPARPQRRPESAFVVDTPVREPVQPRAEDDDDPEPEEQEERIEDAYDLYQRAMREQDMSVLPHTEVPTAPAADFVGPSSPPTPSLLSSTSVGSNLIETWHTTTSGIFNRRSRSSTVGEKSRPVISAPLAPQGESADPSNRVSGIFGSVRRSCLSSSCEQVPLTLYAHVVVVEPRR